MIVLDCIQGTEEWMKARLGIATSSEFDKILTPTGKLSISAEKYTFALLAERIMGHPRVESVSMWMERGHELEQEAVDFYELMKEAETEPIGFIMNDAGTIGASPDRLVGEDGLLEIKCPSEAIHVSYLLKKAVDQAYYPQIQGQLWISERAWVDILSFHPEMPPALVHVGRDEEFIEKLSNAVVDFSGRLEAYSKELVERGWIKAWPIPPLEESPYRRDPGTRSTPMSRTMPPKPSAPEELEVKATASKETIMSTLSTPDAGMGGGMVPPKPKEGPDQSFPCQLCKNNPPRCIACNRELIFKGAGLSRKEQIPYDGFWYCTEKCKNPTDKRRNTSRKGFEWHHILEGEAKLKDEREGALFQEEA